MGRVVSLDYGLARIGIAISDESKMISAYQKVLQTEKSTALTLKKLIAELSQYKIDELIIGLPLHMNGKMSFLADEVMHFIELLKTAFSCPIKTWDERLTTVQAERSLKESNLSRKKRSKVVDAVTATIILQSYLDSLSLRMPQF